MCATLGKSIQKKNKNQGWVFIVNKDANFSHIFGHNQVPYHVFNFIYNNAGEFTLLFSWSKNLIFIAWAGTWADNMQATHRLRNFK